MATNIDLEAPMDYDDAFPGAAPPSARARQVIQLGYMSGALHHGSGMYVDPTFLKHGELQAKLRAAPVDSIVAAISRHSDVGPFIEEFIEVVDRSAKENAEVKEFLDALKTVEDLYGLPHPVGVGLVAIHIHSLRA